MNRGLGRFGLLFYHLTPIARRPFPVKILLVEYAKKLNYPLLGILSCAFQCGWERFGLFLFAVKLCRVLCWDGTLRFAVLPLSTLCAESFSRQRFDARVCQKVKLSLDWFPFLCLSVWLGTVQSFLFRFRAFG